MPTCNEAAKACATPAFSVVTPYHNTDDELFDACARSIMDQTLGFEAIEWVLVMHNCDEEHKAHVHELLDQYPNVRTFELDNDSRGASSPRNFGLSQTTAPYVAFMDADDRYTPDALKRITEYGERFDPDIIVYRRDYELQSPGMTPIAITVPWDRTRDVIVLDRRDAIESRTYNDFPIFITDRAFRRQFLIDNGIAFDEDIMIGEDCYFNLRALHMAERVCYMPQLIGYTYLINDGSILNNEKTDDEVNRVIDNNVAIIERALAYGFYPNHIILAMCFSLSLCLLSRGVSMETRLRAERLMRPYLALTEPIRPDRFLTPLRSALNDLYHDVLMSPERFGLDAHDCIPESFHNLDVILQENADTDYGRRYCFDNVVSYEGYRSLVPLSDVSTYRPMVELETRIGDTNIYHDGAPAYYLKESSGMLPVSATQAATCAQALNQVMTHDVVIVWDALGEQLERARNQSFVGDAYGMALSAWLDARRYTDTESASRLVVPAELAFGGQDTEFACMLLSAADADVEQIVCFGDDVPESVANTLSSEAVLAMADFMDGHDLTEPGNLKPHQSHLLRALVKIDPGRAETLRRLARESEDGRVGIHHLWPRLDEITVIEGRPRGSWPTEIDGVRVRRAFVMNEAGLMAVFDDASGDYVLDTTQAVYEFAIARADGTSAVIPASRVKAGDVVVPIVTTKAGLYRYMMEGIALRVTTIRDHLMHFLPADDGTLAIGVLQ